MNGILYRKMAHRDPLFHLKQDQENCFVQLEVTIIDGNENSRVAIFKKKKKSRLASHSHLSVHNIAYYSIFLFFSLLSPTSILYIITHRQYFFSLSSNFYQLLRNSSKFPKGSIDSGELLKSVKRQFFDCL